MTCEGFFIRGNGVVSSSSGANLESTGSSGSERLTYRTAPPNLPGVRMAFYGLFAAIFVGLDGGLAVFVIRWNHPTAVALFVVLSVLFVGGAYGLSRQVVALLSRKGEVPALGAPSGTARVAVLYATMNDVVPECLQAIHQSYPVDVFVLDDSSDAGARNLVDEIALTRGYSVVRRPVRRGFKAGAINDWYRRWGSKYDFLVLLDADSFLPVDWVSEALRYAEHPANGRTAIFQGLINIWNFDTRFVATLAPMSRVGQFVWEEKLANALDAVFCYGHNVLLRVSALREIGGLIEGYVSEDFATAIALADRGWHSRFLPLHTYEALPENVRGFVRRQNKWTRGAMEFVGLSRRSNLPLSRKFHLWQTPFGHVTNLLLPVGMFLTVYGFVSTPATAAAFLAGFVRNPWNQFWSIALFRYLLVVGVVTFVPTVLVYLRCGVTWGMYWRQRWLSAAVHAVSLPFELRSMVAYLTGPTRPVPVTPKSELSLRGRDVLYLSRYSLVIDGLVLAGLIEVNPVGALFNATWLVPMLAAPWVVYRFSGPPWPEEGPRSVPVGAGQERASLRSEYAVYGSLTAIRASGRLPGGWAAAARAT